MKIICGNSKENELFAQISAARKGFANQIKKIFSARKPRSNLKDTNTQKPQYAQIISNKLIYTFLIYFIYLF